MQCNIDQRGRAVRLVAGMLTGIIGVGLGLGAGLGMLTGWWWWLAAACCLGAAGFQIYEARKGWCVMRAMGFKTPM